MTLLALHAVIYVTVCTLLVLLWLMLGGSPEVLTRPLEGAREEDLWPFWVAAVWGTLLGTHVALVVVLRRVRRHPRRGRRTRRDRRTRRRRRRRQGGAEGRRWITAMFTDISGSTRLVAELGDEAYSELIASHRRTVRELLGHHRGREIGTQGDGFLLRFPSPQDATDYAVRLQRVLAEQRRHGTTTPWVRIGVHAGEVIARDGDVLGRMVNIASRVADTAAPGEILITEPVADHAGPGLRYDDRGLRELRGVEAPRHLLAVRWEDEADDG